MTYPPQRIWHEPGRPWGSLPQIGLIVTTLAILGFVTLVWWINRDRTVTEVSNCQVLSTTNDRSAYGYGDVRAAILNDGHLVVDATGGPGDPFRVPVRIMQVEGHDLRVYQYGNEASRRCDSDTIGMDGWSVNGTPVEWAGTPHRWLRGKVIVLYLGDDTAFIGLVMDAMGPEADVTGH